MYNTHLEPDVGLMRLYCGRGYPKQFIHLWIEQMLLSKSTYKSKT